MLRLYVRKRQRLDRMYARREREKRHPHRLARSRSQRPVVSNHSAKHAKKKTRRVPNAHAALQWQDPRSRAGPTSSTMTLSPTPTFPHTHFKPTRPHALIKHKHIQRKFIPRNEPTRTTVHPNAHNDTLALRDCILQCGCGRAMSRRRR